MQIELNAAVTLFEDPIDFSNYIENEVYKTNKTYLDAILDYCKSRYIDTSLFLIRMLLALLLLIIVMLEEIWK